MTGIVTDTLRPGLLVSLKTSLTGSVDYFKQTIEAAHIVEGVGEKAKWETLRVIADREEHDKGRKAQAEARSCITKVCTNTAFGLLCPLADKEALTQAVAEARLIAEAFNATAKQARLDVFVIKGQVASDDVEAVKAISAEVRNLMQTMEDGVRNVDAKVIREAANEARRLGTMLAPEAAGRLQVAVEAARTAARKIVKAGEQAAQQVDQGAIARLAECRTSFLDLDGAGEVASPETAGRGLDLTPLEQAIEVTAAPAPAAEVD